MKAPVTLSIAQIEACLASGMDPDTYATRLTVERDEREALVEERRVARNALNLAKYAAETAALNARREKIATAATRAAELAAAKEAEAEQLERARASGQRGAESLRRHVLARTIERAGGR